MNTSRSANALKNTAVAFGSYALSILTNLVFRGIFMKLLSKTYLGMQGLFSNIIAFLSLAEMGIGAAITFSLYKPLSEGDQSKIVTYVDFYRKTYHYIALAVFSLGMALLPFLDHFIDKRPMIPEPLELIYALFVINSAVSFLFSYQQTVLVADQKAFIINFWTSMSIVVRNLVQAIWLLATRDYIGTLLIQVLLTLFTNVYISSIATRQYPYLRKLRVAQPLDREERKGLSARVSTLFLYRVGSYTINSTDNILISKYFGLSVLAIFSNYYLLLSVVNAIGNMIASALTPGVGNQAATQDKTHTKSTFLSLQFAFSWLATFLTASLAGLLSPFIYLWAGESFVLPNNIMALMLVNFYLTFKRRLTGTYRNALGLYLQARSMAIIQGVLNIILSLAFLKRLGVIGVILGTTMSDMMVSMWVDPYVLYKYYFNQSVLEYWRNYFISTLVATSFSLLTYFISKSIFNGTLQSFVVLLLICIALPNSCLWLMFRKNTHYQIIVKRVFGIIRSKKALQ